MRGAAGAYIVSYILIGLGVLFVLAVVGMLAYGLYAWICNRTSAVLRVPARVVSKRHRQHDISFDEGSGPGLHAIDNFLEAVNPGSTEILLGQTADCFLTFEFSGRRQEFKIPQSLYTTPEGTEGLLVYQGEIFKHFIPGVTLNLR